MRLIEKMVEANHRAVAGDTSAGLRPADYAESLPLIALTCVDPRLNPLLPEVLGIPEDDFIWLRNAGNIISHAFSSTMRSLALACAIKGGKEIAILGHTDCLVGKTTMSQFLDRMQALGVPRQRLPENLTEYFGLFGSERQNVIHAAEIVRSSPLIGPKIPVHGLLVDTHSGRLEWLVNGYRVLESTPPRPPELASTVDDLSSMGAIGHGVPDLAQPPPAAQRSLQSMSSTVTPIGEATQALQQWVDEQLRKLQPDAAPPPAEKPPLPVATEIPPKLPPKFRLRMRR